MTRRGAGRLTARGGWMRAGALLLAPLAGCALPAPVPDRALPVSQAAPTSAADDPQRLIGLDPARLRGLFGRRGLVRSDAPAEVWQYRTRGCVRDLFLYKDKDGMRLHYLEARDPAAREAAAPACVDAVMASRDRTLRIS